MLAWREKDKKIDTACHFINRVNINICTTNNIKKNIYMHMVCALLSVNISGYFESMTGETAWRIRDEVIL